MCRVGVEDETASRGTRLRTQVESLLDISTSNSSK